MKWNREILKAEADTFKKIQAFRLFKERGTGIIAETFPSLKDFILQNQHKTIPELEQELLHALEEQKLHVA